MRITLDISEAQFIEVAAAMRHSRHLTRTNTYELTEGEQDGGRDEDAIGMYGEYVVSLALDLSWRPVVENPWALPCDVGKDTGIQVRTTKKAENTHLILNRKDNKDSLFVLVRRLDLLTFVIDGWIEGSEGKKPEFWRTEGIRYPAYFVPPTALNPIETLLPYIIKKGIGNGN